tara:strand:+ start:682 stop:1113 length:432 start_codon:yes stop_codon:yes gene_type:complete
MDIILCVLCAFLWAVSITIEKFYILTKYKAYQMMLLRPLFFLITSGAIVYYMDNGFSFLKKVDKKDLAIVGLAVLVNTFTLIAFFYLLQKNKTNYTLSITHPLFIIFSILLAYIFAGEKVNKKQSLGILLVLLGVVLINYFKD